MSECKYPPAHSVGDYRNCGCGQDVKMPDYRRSNKIHHLAQGLALAQCEPGPEGPIPDAQDWEILLREVPDVTPQEREDFAYTYKVTLTEEI